MILNLLFLIVLLIGRVEKHVEGVWRLELVGRCLLDYHANIHAVALACPGVDYIKLWPVTQPWGDPTDTWPGWNARTPPSEAGFFELWHRNSKE